MAKILIVEDDKSLQDVYAEVLRGDGHEIETADDGEVALSKMNQGGWDLVLLDIVLPKINGIDIMQQMVNNPPTNPNKSVVFLTNIDQGEELKKALSLGNGYIMKSQITPGDLVGEVNLYLPALEKPGAE
jgi:CheY-like chemotaxis protein